MARYFSGLLILLTVWTVVVRATLMHTAPSAAPVPEATNGPQCTLAYPRGFKFTKRARKHPTCTEMDVDAIVWGKCTRRIKT